MMMEQISSLVKQTENSARLVLDTASSLSEASKKTAISAKEIATATEEIAKGVTSLAVEAERGNDLTVLMSSQMLAVIDANKAMDESAQQVERSSSLGASNMNELLGRTSSTGDMMHSLASKVNQITERIQQEMKETTVALSSVFPIFEQQAESVRETDSIFSQVQDQMNGMLGSLGHVTASIEQLHGAQSILVEAMAMSALWLRSHPQLRKRWLH